MASRPSRVGLEILSALLRFFLRLVRSRSGWSRFRSLGGISFGRRTAEAAFATWASTFSRAIHAARSTLATTTTEGLAHFFDALGVFFLGDGAISVGIQAFEGFFGVAKHATTTTATAITFWASALTWRAWRSTFGTWRTTEAAALATRRTHALTALTTTPHHLHHLADLVLIDDAVAIGVHAGKTLFVLLLAQRSKFFLADLAVAIGVGAFDKCSDAFGWISTARRRAALGTTRRRRATLWASWRRTTRWTTIRRRAFGGVLSAGEAGQAQNAEPVEECFFEFHIVRVFG